MSLETGQTIEGKYRIKGLIGEGGMGAVYEGENIRIQRRVAIKVLHPSFTQNEDVMARFQREAQAAGRIGNDHILEVLDLGSLPDGSHFMVLEFLDGEPLSNRIQRVGRMQPSEVAPLARQMLKGLQAAHAAGIVHRDLKPDNIFILKEKAGTPDFVKIIDFGISKFQPLSGDGMKMTRTGAVMGTPYYMSPEQASGSREADARSDLYTAGVILYECVTGHVPFDGETFNQLMFKIVLSEPPPLMEQVPDLDPAFASIILKAMARDVSQRFQTADEFGKAIVAWEKQGAKVSVPPATASSALNIPGVTRASLESAAGHLPGARGTLTDGKNMGAGAAAGARPGNGTVGNWAASSQVSAAPPRNTIIIAAIAGGLVLAGGIAAAIALSRGSGDHTAATEGSGHVAAAASAVAPPASAEPTPATPPATPLAAEPAVTATPATATPPAVAPVEKPSASKPAAGASKPSAGKPRPVEKPAGKQPGKPAGGSAGPDFGY
jgi:serine/threonine-protein kinase